MSRRHYLLLLATLALLAAAILHTRWPAPSHPPPPSTAAGGGFTLTVLVDNHPYRRGLETAWGFSLLVSRQGRYILFDTGPSPRVLEENAARLGVDLSRVSVIVVSHRHMDHCGGLPALPRAAQLYIPPDPWLASYAEGLGFNPVEVNNTRRVAPGVYVLAPLYGPPWEVALALVTGRGVVVVTGCAHPGVVGFVREALRLGRVYMVIGGFHLAGAPAGVVRGVVEELVSLGVEKIAPLHCSGEAIVEYLRERHPGMLVEAGVGYTLRLPGG